MSCAALTACGGGGGGGGGGGSDGGASIADPANTYFPTASSLQWTYSIVGGPSGGGTTTLGFSDDTTVKVAGVKTRVHALLYPTTGGKEYYVTASDKISLQGLYIPTILVGGSSYSADGRFSEPVAILDTSAGAATTMHSLGGSGKVKISGYSSRSMSYSGSVTYFGEEDVVVGTTTYAAARHVLVDLTMTATVEGTNFSIPYTVEFWIADGYGIVQRSQSTVTYQLLSKS